MDTLFTTSEVAQTLKVAEVTLRKWRISGCGPRFVRVGANVRYLSADVLDWLTRRSAASTSEPQQTTHEQAGAR